MLYEQYTIGGELMHSERGSHKYLDKVRTKTGKWRYIYDKKISGKSNRARRNELLSKANREYSNYATRYMSSGKKPENYDRAEELHKQRLAAVNRMDDEYDKTVAGKIDKVKEKASNVTNDAAIKVDNIINDVLDKVNKKKKKKK